MIESRRDTLYANKEKKNETFGVYFITLLQERKNRTIYNEHLFVYIFASFIFETNVCMKHVDKIFVIVLQGEIGITCIYFIKKKKFKKSIYIYI